MEKPSIVVLRSGGRCATVGTGVLSRHSFSFGRHYDADNVNLSVLLAHNEELLQPAAGHAWHRHRDVDVVTFVAAGRLLHRDSVGNQHVLGPGDVQRLHAGSGVDHCEVNPAAGAAGEPCRFVQLWIASGGIAPQPAYGRRLAEDRRAINPVAADDPVMVAAGCVDGACNGQQAPALWLAWPGVQVWLWQPPDTGRARWAAAQHVHVFVVDGATTLEGIVLQTGDSARLVGHPGLELACEDGATVLVCAMP